jgi:hypothetical protein
MSEVPLYATRLSYNSTLAFEPSASRGAVSPTGVPHLQESPPP